MRLKHAPRLLMARLYSLLLKAYLLLTELIHCNPIHVTVLDTHC